MLECYREKVPEIRIVGTCTALFQSQLNPCVSRFRDRFRDTLLKNDPGRRILIDDFVFQFVVQKYAVDHPYMDYDANNVSSLPEADHNIAKKFHDINAAIRSVTQYRLWLINRISDSAAPVSNPTPVNNPSLDEGAGVPDDVSYSLVKLGATVRVPYRVYFPQLLLNLPYWHAFPNGYNNDDIEEGDDTVAVCQAIVKSITSQNIFTGPGFDEMHSAVLDEILSLDED